MNFTLPFGLGKECVVLAAPNVQAWLDAGTALANDDRAAGDGLSAEGFDAQDAVRSSRGRCGDVPLAFFVCHNGIPYFLFSHSPLKPSNREFLSNVLFLGSFVLLFGGRLSLPELSSPEPFLFGRRCCVGFFNVPSQP